MPVQKTYEARGRSIGSFSYTELSTGRSIKKLYLCDFEGPLYQLLEDVNYGNLGYISKGGATSFDIDFDLSINRPITLQGLGSVSFPLAFTGNAAFDETFTVTLRKLSGTTETNLATDNVNLTGNAGVSYLLRRRTFYLSIPLTTFKKGDTLRVTFSSDTIDAGTEATLGTDPKNRSDFGNIAGIAVDWSLIGSESFILLPVRILI